MESVLLLAFLCYYVADAGRSDPVLPVTIADYSEFIEDFPSERVLGPVASVAEARTQALNVWEEIYGNSNQWKRHIEVFFDDENQVWLVRGKFIGYGVGGVPYIIIQKEDGKVLAVWHDK